MAKAKITIADAAAYLAKQEEKYKKMMEKGDKYQRNTAEIKLRNIEIKRSQLREMQERKRTPEGGEMPMMQQGGPPPYMDPNSFAYWKNAVTGIDGVSLQDSFLNSPQQIAQAGFPNDPLKTGYLNLPTLSATSGGAGSGSPSGGKMYNNVSIDDALKLFREAHSMGFDSKHTDPKNPGDVKAYQQFLKDRGMDLGSFGANKDGIDSKFGDQTLAAGRNLTHGLTVNKFTQPLGVGDDGIPGMSSDDRNAQIAKGMKGNATSLEPEGGFNIKKDGKGFDASKLMDNLYKVAPFLDNMVNQKIIENMEDVPVPIREKSLRQPEKVRLDNTRNRVEEQTKTISRGIDQSTASRGTGRNTKLAAMSEMFKTYGNIAQAEQQINQRNRMVTDQANVGIEARNVARDNKFLLDKLGRDDLKKGMISQNFANAIEDFRLQGHEDALRQLDKDKFEMLMKSFDSGVIDRNFGKYLSENFPELYDDLQRKLDEQNQSMSKGK